MSAYIIKDGELYHWGVKGMRWGVRRYQKADGSLTAAGRRRYAKEEYGKEKEQVRDQIYKEIETESRLSKSNSKLKKVYDQWRKNNPDADDDDFGDYMLDNNIGYESPDRHELRAQRLQTKQNSLRKEYVKEQAQGTAVVSSILAPPLASVAAYKIAKASGVSGKKRVAIALAAGAGTTLVFTTRGVTEARQTAKNTEKEYGIKSVRERVREMKRGR